MGLLWVKATGLVFRVSCNLRSIPGLVSRGVLHWALSEPVTQAETKTKTTATHNGDETTTTASSKSSNQQQRQQQKQHQIHRQEKKHNSKRSSSSSSNSESSGAAAAAAAMSKTHCRLCFEQVKCFSFARCSLDAVAKFESVQTRQFEWKQYKGLST